VSIHRDSKCFNPLAGKLFGKVVFISGPQPDDLMFQSPCGGVVWERMWHPHAHARVFQRFNPLAGESFGKALRALPRLTKQTRTSVSIPLRGSRLGKKFSLELLRLFRTLSFNPLAGESFGKVEGPEFYWGMGLLFQSPCGGVVWESWRICFCSRNASASKVSIPLRGSRLGKVMEPAGNLAIPCFNPLAGESFGKVLMVKMELKI